MLQAILKCMETYYRLGYTISEIDKLLEPYAELSYKHYCQEYKNICDDVMTVDTFCPNRMAKYAMRKVEREMEQGFQGLEMKLNSVGSSRGDYPKQNWGLI